MIERSSGYRENTVLELNIVYKYSDFLKAGTILSDDSYYNRKPVKTNIIAIIFMTLCIIGIYFLSKEFLIYDKLFFLIVVYGYHVRICSLRKKRCFSMLKRFSNDAMIDYFFVDRNASEVRIMKVPCKYIFYETYVKKVVPLYDSVKDCKAEDVENLPVVFESIQIEYCACRYFAIGKKYLSLNENIFIPLDQINKDEKNIIDNLLSVKKKNKGHS